MHIRHAVLRLVIGLAFATTPLIAHAVVFTTDYGNLAALPALTSMGTSKDWRANGVVTPVKNEGTCDASWAFGVTGLVEGYHAINTAQLFSLSEQQLVDCTGSGSGCAGGNPVEAMRKLIERGGIATAANYPYTAQDGTCKATAPAATIPGAGRVPPGDDASLQAYVDRGPVMALVGESLAFNAYSGGVFSGPCSTSPTRAVLIVGYGTSSGVDYWIVKNSRGASWGASGYIFIARHQNLCGIENYAVAVSADRIPPPSRSAQAIPALSDWAVHALTLGFAALGFLAVHKGRRKASG